MREAQEKLTVLLVDDSEEFLDAAASWIGTQSSLRLAGTARDGEQAVEATLRLTPDLVLIDAFMPVLDGFEATRRIKTRAGAPLVVMFSIHEGQTMEREAWAAGADGFVPKADLAGRLIEAIEKIRAGDARVQPPRHEGTPSLRPRTARAEDDGSAGQ
jgi:DNA-binding NarL/FixJ family response regulator